jgi:HEAT repeat protein
MFMKSGRKAIILLHFWVLFAFYLLTGCAGRPSPNLADNPEVSARALTREELRLQELEARVEMLEGRLEASTERISELERERRALYLRLLEKEAEVGDYQALALTLSDRDEKVRAFAAVKLGELGYRKPASQWMPEVHEALVAALSDEVVEVRQAAAQALGELGHLLPTSRPRLEKVLEDPSPEVRAAGATALGKLKAKESLWALVRLTRDPQPTVRARAIDALGNLGEKEVATLLARHLEDKDHSVRESTARALGKIKEPATVAALLAAFEDEDERVRWYAAASLGEIGEKGAVLGLTRVLKEDASPGVRQAACAALGKIKDERAIGPLKEAFYDENSPVKDEAWAAFLETVKESPALLAREGSELYEKEDFGRAAQLLSLAAEDPSFKTDTELWLKLARSYEKIEQWSKAAEAFKAAVESGERESPLREIRLEYVEALTKAERGLEAIEVYKGLISEAPEESAPLWAATLKIIQGLYEKGRYEAVVAAVEGLNASFPEMGGEEMKEALLELLALSQEEIKKAQEEEAKAE